MTESQWLAATDTRDMLRAVSLLPLTPAAVERAHRLFCVGCCRLLGPKLLAESLKGAVNVAERFALGAATADELLKASRSVAQRSKHLSATLMSLLSSTIVRPHRNGTVPPVSPESARMAVVRLLCLEPNAAAPADAHDPAHPWHAKVQAAVYEVDRSLVALLHCIVGNPFRPVVVDASWLTSTVKALAQGIFAECAMDRLPILADALQDAGCEHEFLLTHLRGPGPHSQGCWALGLIRGNTK